MDSSTTEPAILFFHKGKIPYYLRCTMESARFFNPGSRIILLADELHDFGALRVDVREINSLIHPKLEQFLNSYVHISGIKEFYERLFIERWFHLSQLIHEEKIAQALYLDSDSMLFAKASDLFTLIPAQAQLCSSRAGGPACTFIRNSLNPFLEYILARYQDQPFLDEWKKRSDAAIARKGLDNLGDMVFMELFTTTQPMGAVYPNQLEHGHIDHCIHVPDGVESRKKRRHKSIKRIFWKDENNQFLPYFKKVSDGSLTRAWAVHFQSGAKRKIRQFNRVHSESPWPRSWRLAYYNWLLN